MRIVLLPLLLLFTAASLRAEEAKAPGNEKKEAAAEADSSKPAETDHSISIGGKPVKYHATTGYLVLKEEVGKAPEGDKAKAAEPVKDGLKPKARVFYTAYTVAVSEGVRRPVTFVFNGGPGAASVWLHLGALGPRRIRLAESGAGTPAPYQLIDNEYSCLDRTDLVFIDPVSTGYSRPAMGEDAREFHGFQEDLQSVAEFIRAYLTQNNRWLAPKFLIGESYGGTRAAALAEVLQKRFDIYVNGIVIISGVLNWQTIDPRLGNELPFPLFLPSYTAAAWYHKKLAGALQQAPLEQALREAEAFADHDYLLALQQGSRLPEPERARIAGRLVALTGLPLETILRYNLRVPVHKFMEELLKADRRNIGRFDSRLTGIMSDPDGADFDPSFTTMRGSYTAAINDYARTELKFQTELPYRSLADVHPWNFSNFENHYVEVGEGLAHAMAMNPTLKVWVITGAYDLAVCYYGTEYALKHLPLDPAIAPNLHSTSYEAGHMFYTQDGPLKKFKADYDAFVSKTLP